jgi:hypothetical protein
MTKRETVERIDEVLSTITEGRAGVDYIGGDMVKVYFDGAKVERSIGGDSQVAIFSDIGRALATLF